MGSTAENIGYYLDFILISSRDLVLLMASFFVSAHALRALVKKLRVQIKGLPPNFKSVPSEKF